MPRKPRLHIPGAVYHVMLRGNDRQALFFNTEDRVHLNQLIGRATADVDADVHAFCWMTNHIHLAVQIGDIPLGRLIQWVASRYAYYLNRRLGRTGHVFERRYRAVLVDIDAYLLALVRYIHMNPIVAGMVGEPARYDWSSHRYYLGRGKLDWLSTEWILSQFGYNLNCARKKFHQFVVQPDADELPDELINGSDGDERITGGNRLLDEYGSHEHKSLSPFNLNDIIQSVCRKSKMDFKLVAGPSRQRDVVRVRAEISIRAIEEGVATYAELGRRLNRSDVAIAKLVRRYSNKISRQGSLES